MKLKNTNKDLMMLIGSMCIFGTIGILRKYIEMPSSFIALCRAVVGAIFLITVVLFRKRSINFSEIRKNLPWLILSGAFLGFNWILLFEAYQYTTVTCATLCYYMAPSIAVVASHLLFNERLSFKKSLCVLVALFGMILVSGIIQTGILRPSEIRGILYGLGAAVLYASVVLLNKKLTISSAFDKTIFQLGIAAVILLPYTFFTEDMSQAVFSPLGVFLLIVAGIVHTGIAYAMYFGSIRNLNTQSVALLSYVDPILAIILSTLFLNEAIGVEEIVGAILILGAAYTSEK